MNRYQSVSDFKEYLAIAASNQVEMIFCPGDEKWHRIPIGDFFDLIKGVDVVVWYPRRDIYIPEMYIDLKVITEDWKCSGFATISLTDIEGIKIGRKMTTHFGIFNGYVKEKEPFIRECTKIYIVSVKRIIEEIESGRNDNVIRYDDFYKVSLDWIEKNIKDSVPGFEDRKMKRKLCYT